jgi:hypothetical protein
MGREPHRAALDAGQLYVGTELRHEHRGHHRWPLASSSLDRRARVLAAMVRLLLLLVRVSGFSLLADDSPRARPRRMSSPPSRERRPSSLLPSSSGSSDSNLPAIMPGAMQVRTACSLADRPSCPRSSPGQLTPSSSIPAQPNRQFLHDSRADAVAYAGVWNVPVRSTDKRDPHFGHCAAGLGRFTHRPSGRAKAIGRPPVASCAFATPQTAAPD